MDNTGETGKRYTIIAVIETNAMIELPETDNITWHINLISPVPS